MTKSNRVKEWDEYFGIHCHLPASAIRDLFEEIERLEGDVQILKLQRDATHVSRCPNCGPKGA